MNQDKPGYFETFAGELWNTVIVEILLSAAVWKTWPSRILSSLYVLGGIALILLLIRARRIDTTDSYDAVGKFAFFLIVAIGGVELFRLR